VLSVLGSGVGIPGVGNELGKSVESTAEGHSSVNDANGFLDVNMQMNSFRMSIYSTLTSYLIIRGFLSKTPKF
jgi:hypothetical protein